MFKGKKQTKENIEKNRQGHLGLKRSAEAIRHFSETMMGHIVSDESRRKSSETQKKQWEDPEYKEYRLKQMYLAKNLSPNKSESFVLFLLNWLYPDMFKFVGDLSCIIGGKNPDFICEERKLIIEYNGFFYQE